MQNDNYRPYTNTLFFASELVAKGLQVAMRHLRKNLKLELNHEEFIILESIYLNPGIIQIDIAKRIIMKRSYVCKFLSEMEEKGYIRKEIATKCEKQIIVKNYLTELGEEKYIKTRDALVAHRKILPPEEIKDLDELRDNMFKLAERIKTEYKLKL
jgi:DNA-binding MarR family transcriptional regulator